ncbi:MAG: pirin family protein [Castellaniella sp.]
MSNPLPDPEAESCESRPMPQAAIQSWPAREADLGAGLKVSRVLPLHQHRMVGPWCFLDSFGPLSFTDGKAMDIAPHPHIGLQTVSWLFSGEILHNDSLGSECLVRPGQLNLMTAGRGISHTEQTPSAHSGQLHGLQLWVALPDAHRQCEPHFDHYTDLPVLEPGGGRIHIFTGQLAGADANTRTYSPMVGAELNISAHSTLQLPLDPTWEHALVVISGEISLEGQSLAPGSLHYLGTQRHGLELVCRTATRAVLIGGAPFGETIMIWWNFVGRTLDDIRQARTDWENRQRFGEVAAYHGQRLPAPELVGRPIAR